MDRYVRQETYLGKKAQERLNQSKAAVIGLGALGSVVADLLARAGVGKILLYDRDTVELQNLQRQTLYDEKDVNIEKANVAARKLRNINSSIEIVPRVQNVNYQNIDLNADVVVDCTDNLETRFLLNDYCKKNKIPMVHGSVAGTIGNVLVITKDSACYSCIFRKKGDELNCETQGIINAASHIVASIQSYEAIKILIGKKPEENLLHINLENNEMIKIKVKKDPKCEACSKQYDYLVQKEKTEQLKSVDFTISLCKTKAAMTVKPKKNVSLELKKLKKNFEIRGETPIVYVIKKDNSGEIIVHNYGELIFKELKDEEKIKELAEEIYKEARK